MKSIALPLIVLLSSAVQADTFFTALPPSGVTVYPQGAMVTSQVELDLPSGVHEILFPVAVSDGAPTFTISEGQILGFTSVAQLQEDKTVFLTDAQTEALDKVESQRDVVAVEQGQLQQLHADAAGLEAQERYLRSIVPGSENPQSMEQLQAISDFLPQALQANAANQAALRDEIALQTKKVAEENLILTRLETRLRGMGLPSDHSPMGQLTVVLDQARVITLNQETFTPSAGWSMTYDAYLDEDSAVLTLERQAVVQQNTGTGWDNIDLTLSSARPFQQLNPDIPNRDIVHLMNDFGKLSSGSYRSAETSAPRMEAEMVADSMVQMAAPVGGRFDGVEVLFNISTEQTIATGTGANHVSLAPLAIDVDVSRYANPRRDKTAFVRATFVNSTGEPILSGNGSFYRGNSLIGHGSIPLIFAGAEEKLHFGPDETLPIEMQFLSELSGDRGFISRSDTREEKLAFEVQNLAGTDQSITLAYALPIAVDEDVAIQTTTSPRPERTDVDGEKGVVEWDFDLKPGETRRVALEFEISWPDGSEINWQP